MKDKTTRESIDEFQEAVRNLKEVLFQALKPTLDKATTLLVKMGILEKIEK